MAGCSTSAAARARSRGCCTPISPRSSASCSPEMLAEGQRQAAAAGAGAIRWLQMAAEEVAAELGRFRLVTLGNSFHWMDQDDVLKRAYDLLDPDGGVVILGNPGGVWGGEQPFERAVREVIQHWLGEQRRTRAGAHNPVENAEKGAMRRSRFVDIEMGEERWQRPVNVETILGELFSTSFANKALLGDRTPGFEADVRRALLALEPSGRFTQHLRTEYIFGFKR
ncbi:MAG: class I SAM-dependent methyltransferase [Dehalococcoidia bacterium]